MVKLTRDYLESSKIGRKYDLNKLVGTSIDTLTVVRVYRDFRKHVILILKCDCGYLTSVSLHSIIGKLDTYHCNNLSHKVKIKYKKLIGTRIKGYELLDILGVRSGKPLFKLKCDCGNILELTKYELDRVKLQCDCKVRDYNYFYDISTELGKEYNDLLVVNVYRDFKGHFNYIFCDVKCRCGSYSKKLYLSALKKGGTKSCGCSLPKEYNCESLIGREVDGFLVKDFYKKGLDGYFFLVSDKKGVNFEIYSADLLKGRFPSYWFDIKSSKKVRVSKNINRRYSTRYKSYRYLVCINIDGSIVHKTFGSFSDAVSFLEKLKKQG